jgi:heme/copper-type cytochrome/quinol oxidase subunit 4
LVLLGSEEKQKPYWVMLGVVFLLLGVAMIVVGGYWWMTS